MHRVDGRWGGPGEGEMTWCLLCPAAGALLPSVSAVLPCGQHSHFKVSHQDLGCNEKKEWSRGVGMPAVLHRWVHVSPCGFSCRNLFVIFTLKIICGFRSQLLKEPDLVRCQSNASENSSSET